MLQPKKPRFVFKKTRGFMWILGIAMRSWWDPKELSLIRLNAVFTRRYARPGKRTTGLGPFETDGWKRKRMESFLRFLTPKWTFSGLITKNAGSARNCPFKLWRFAKRERLLPGFEWVLPKHCWRMKVDKDPLVKWWWLFSYCEPGFTQAQTHWCKLACHSCV